MGEITKLFVNDNSKQAGPRMVHFFMKRIQFFSM